MNSGASVLQALLEENPNHPKIKETLQLICQTREKVTYHSLVSSSETYLHVMGLANHNYDEFNYINKLLYHKILGVCAKIKRQELVCKNPLQQYQEALLQQEREEEQKIKEIAAEVEHVVNNVDLPLSLFKRNDKYWYPDNPKTIEAKNFVHQRIEQDRKRKRKFKSQIMKIQNQRQIINKSQEEKQRKFEEELRKKKHEEINSKIEGLKKSTEERMKLIEESKKFGSSLKPLFRKIEGIQKKKETNALDEYKQKLSEIRSLHRSIDISQIKEHQEKLMKLQKQKEQKNILDEPLKVSFKSKYHSSMTSRSRMSEYETTKSLYEKRREYGTIIKQQFRPDIDEKLVKEMQERLKIMNRRRTRKNPKKKNQKKRGDDDDEEEEDEEDEEEEEEKEDEKPKTPKKLYDSDDEDEDEDEDDVPKKVKRIRGQDEDPDREERYELGVNYLEYVRSLPKKKKQQKNGEEQGAQQQLIKEQLKTKNSQRYKDYLREFVKTNRTTIQHIDTSRMKKDYNKSIVNSTDYDLFNRLENQARKVQMKIKNEEQLLKHRKLKDQDAMNKKVEIDNAVIDTIKARLAMMG